MEWKGSSVCWQKEIMGGEHAMQYWYILVLNRTETCWILLINVTRQINELINLKNEKGKRKVNKKSCLTRSIKLN